MFLEIHAASCMVDNKAIKIKIAIHIRSPPFLTGITENVCYGIRTRLFNVSAIYHYADEIVSCTFFAQLFKYFKLKFIL